MFIREMMEHDLSQVIQLEKELFVVPWSLKDFMYEVKENPFSCCYVMIDDEKVIAYIVYWIAYEKAEIATIGVSSVYQRQGIASQMLERCIDEVHMKECENITLEVRQSNTKAIGLYKKFGFEEKAIRKNYYQDNHEDAYLMEKRIGGKA